MNLDTIDPRDQRSVMATARWAGLLQILGAVPAGFSVSVLQKLVVHGDPAATARNILASERLFRLGFVVDIVGLVIFIASGVLVYEIFRPAGRRWAPLFLVLISMGTLAQAFECIPDLATLSLLKGGAVLAALPRPEATALAMMFLRLHSYCYQLGLFFDAWSFLVLAVLVVRSTFVPRVLGYLLLIDCAGFLTFTIGSFLASAIVARLYPVVPFGTTIGEFALFVWLLVKGVNVVRWQEQAAASNRPAA